MNNLKFSSRIAAASGSSVLAGAILFGLDARAGAAWARSSFATGLSIGAGFAILGFIFGILTGRLSRAMAQLGAQFQGKPTSEQMTRMQAIRKQQATYSTLTTVTLVLAVVFMSIARYL
jgi:Na+/glutamate symporter